MTKPTKSELASVYVTHAELAEIGRLHAKQIAQVQEALNRRLLWRGTWRSGDSYQSNDMVQDKSTIHVCVAAETSERPGEGAGWRQLVRVAK